MGVCHKLDLEVAARGGQLHHKDGGSGHLALHLTKDGLHLLVVHALADALAAAAPRGLEHHGVAHPGAGGHRLLRAVHTCLSVYVGRDNTVAVLEGDADAGSAPWQSRHAGRLGEDRGANLVSQGSHGDGSRAKEPDADLVQGVWQVRVLRGVAPSRPHGLDPGTLGDLQDELHICVVVVIGAAGDLHKLVCEADVLGVGLDVLRGCHGHQHNGLARAKRLVGPGANGAHELGGSVAIVGHKDTVDWLVASEAGDIGADLLGRVLACLGHTKPERVAAGTGAQLAWYRQHARWQLVRGGCCARGVS
mmetsp:Transcript_7504/g.21243  ORF Transcript_7504/g.21243 Transcript_7504/m.21243 type:complete len:306 (-) Transcript_7504:285-1202(-)